MDYSQFLYMKEELSLIAVILIIFLADLFMDPEKRNTPGHARFATLLPIALLIIHTVINLVPAAGNAEAFWRNVSIYADANHYQSSAQHRHDYRILYGCRMAEAGRYSNQTR